MSDLTHAVIRARLTALRDTARALRHHERNEHQHPNSAMAFACASVLGQQLDSALAACADLDTLVAALTCNALLPCSDGCGRGATVRIRCVATPNGDLLSSPARDLCAPCSRQYFYSDCNGVTRPRFEVIASAGVPPGEYVCTRCGLREQRGEAPKGDF